MKKIILLFICILSFLQVCPAIAQDLNPYTYTNAQNPKDQGLKTDNSNKDTEGSDDFYNEMINEQYGSNLSPAFNNREDINPGESDYGYGYTDGMEGSEGYTDPYQNE